MRIALVHQHFRVPSQGGGIRTWYLAQALADRGHHVEVYTAHQELRYQQKEHGACSIHYFPTDYQQRYGLIRRGKAFFRFVFQAAKALAARHDFDVLYTVTTPLSVPLVGFLLKRWRGTPFLVEVGDLWPDAPIQLGYLKNPLLQKVALGIERHIYQQALRVIAYTPGIAQAIRRKAQGIEPVVIPNVADCDFFMPVVSGTRPFTIGYFGAAGKANHLEFLLNAAAYFLRQAAPLAQVRFWIAAEGSELGRLKQMATSLPNVTFFSYTDKVGVRQLLAETDACYISFIDRPILETGCPNKFFDALAAGKLCILNFRGWLYELVTQHQCGFYAPPHDPAAFAVQLLPYLENPALLASQQSNARQLAETEFDTAQLMSRLVTTIESAYEDYSRGR
ncbi:Glycosyltransferase involved in cell wall bisynthesis [Catalinimonas alkaloidigena]|uniref:Glycosyltransferase involved in cell wall bisynthesis n=1 Tax=Catalinimonas alkaloidigena TaxID=1075417 RepID=A0A1G9ESL5_9BACT|nr:glycosyltransferase family 4 protein [Catalinimonas alkaloidigena]SDK79139.1 Glycosyltransferase involved in cell wall bisynthesis [Catalinimonas alkaloidigena]